jgi:predicted restriction endonuclease
MSKLHPSTFKNIYAIEAKTRADLRKNEATKKAKQAQLQKKQYHQEVNREWKWGMKNPLRKTSESEAPTTQESAPVAQESTKVEDKSTDVKRD